MRKALSVAIATILVAAACSSAPQVQASPSAPQASTAANATAPTNVAKTVVKIGVSCPLSGGGAFHGTECVKGVELAASQMNASDPRYTYVVVTADDECTPDGGRSALVKLTQVDRVNALLTSNCSGAVLGGMQLLQDEKVPGVVHSATNPAITQQAGTGGNQYIWRINSQDAMFAKYFAKYIADKKVKTIAFFATNNDYGRGVVDAFKAQFDTLGVKIVSTQYFTQGASDFRPQLTAIKASGAEAILAPANHPDAIVALREMKELGMTQKFYARADVVSPLFRAKAGDPTLGEGVEEATYWDSTLTDDPTFEPDLMKMFNSQPSLNAYMSYWALRAIGEAIKLGGGAEREQINKGLGMLDLKTPLGRFKFDDHHQAASDVFIMGFTQGKIKLIQRITPS